MRRSSQFLLGGLLLFVLAAASGFSSCSNGYTVPFGAVAVNPSSIAFAVCVTPTPVAFTASQMGNFNSSFTVQSSATSVATVTATSPPGTFLVTDTAGTTPGSATITVTGGGNMQATVSVAVQQCVCVRHRDMWVERR